MKALRRGTSKQYCVWMNCAPAAIFFASRNARHSKGGANGFSAAPKNTRGAKVTLRPLWKRCSSRSVRADLEQRHAIEIEHRLRLRMIAVAARRRR